MVRASTVENSSTALRGGCFAHFWAAERVASAVENLGSPPTTFLCITITSLHTRLDFSQALLTPSLLNVIDQWVGGLGEYICVCVFVRVYVRVCEGVYMSVCVYMYVCMPVWAGATLYRERV